MERAIIQWNVPNILSIVLMAAVGFTVTGFVYHAITGGIKGNKKAAS